MIMLAILAVMVGSILAIPLLQARDTGAVKSASEMIEP